MNSTLKDNTLAEENGEKSKSGLADSALFLAALGAIAYFVGAKYYEGYFGYFGLKTYLAEVPAERYVSESVHVDWQLLAGIVGMVIITGFQRLRPQSRCLYRLFAAPWIWSGLVGLWNVFYRIEYRTFDEFIVVLAVSGVLFAIGLAIAAFPKQLRGIWGGFGSMGTTVSAVLLVVFLALPFLLVASARGKSLAMRAVSGTETFSRRVPGGDLPHIPGHVPAKEYFLALHRDGWLYLTPIADPPPESAPMLVLRADRLTSYSSLPAAEGPP
jgi:hypothetical protein